MGLSAHFKARARYSDLNGMGLIGGAPAHKLLCYKLIGIVLAVGAATVNSASAQQTATKAETVLAAKISCKDFIKNSDGTWTSGPDTKIGANAFPNHTFDINGVSIGGADLATVLNRKCRG